MRIAIVLYTATLTSGTEYYRRREAERQRANSFLVSSIVTPEGLEAGPGACELTVALRSRWLFPESDSLATELTGRVPAATAHYCIDPRRSLGWSARLSYISIFGRVLARLSTAADSHDTLLLSCYHGWGETKVQASYRFPRNTVSVWADEVKPGIISTPATVDVDGQTVPVSRLKDVCVRFLQVREATWRKLIASARSDYYDWYQETYGARDATLRRSVAHRARAGHF